MRTIHLRVATRHRNNQLGKGIPLVGDTKGKSRSSRYTIAQHVHEDPTIVDSSSRRRTLD